MSKLIRDKVISMTNEGDKVGVYLEGDDKERFIEMSPEQADKVISAYNGEYKVLLSEISDYFENQLVGTDEDEYLLRRIKEFIK